MTAEQDRIHARTLAHEQRTQSLRSVDLVAANGVKVNAQSGYVDRHLPQRLNAIRMQIDGRLARDTGDFRDGLHSSELVVGVHDRNQQRRRAQRAADIVGIHHAAGTYANIRDFNALAFELSAGIQNRGVLNGGRHKMLLRSPRMPHNAEDRQVIGFGAAAREHDLL